MSKIDDLIAGLCPDGVEFKELKTLGRRNKGTPITASKMKTLHLENGNVRIFAGGKTIADVDSSTIPEKNIITDPSIIVKSRGHIGFTYYDKPFSHKNELWSYTIDSDLANQKFIYYYLLTQATRLQEIARATSVKLPQLSVSDTDNLKIPVPPIEVQREIVEILDKFTNLEAELEAELEARKKQYEFYRNSLLTFEPSKHTHTHEIRGEVKWLALGDFAMIKNGSDWKKLKTGDIPVYGSGGIMTFVDTFAYDKPTVLIPRKGTITNIFYTDKPFWNVDTIYYTVIDTTRVVPKFFYYLMKTIDLTKMDTGSGRPSLTQAILNRIKMPIPPLAEQNRIVSILDKFETLTTNISEGLPAEIAARRKQYEYYRDKLLTFKELEQPA